MHGPGALYLVSHDTKVYNKRFARWFALWTMDGIMCPVGEK